MPQFRVMGIVNLTPDSFSDGGRYVDAADALRHAEQLVREGKVIYVGSSNFAGWHIACM